MPREYLSTRPKKLSKATVEGWISKHIPYRVRSLKRAAAWKFSDDAQGDAALIHARWCSQLLGIGKTGSTLRPEWNYLSFDGKTSAEVRAVDLNGDNVNPDKLKSRQRKMLFSLLTFADKATAHPTCAVSGRKNSNRQQVIYDAKLRHALQNGSQLLLELLNKNIGTKNATEF